MTTVIRKLQTILLPILGAGAIGACPLCWVGSASLLTYLGFGALIPIWRQIAFIILFIAGVGFILDFRSHKNIIPFVLLTIGSVLLFLGRYVFTIQPPQHIFSGIEGFAGWPVWGTGGILIVAAVIYNKSLFKRYRS